MFNKEQMNAYNNIKAPAELRYKVLETDKREKTGYSKNIIKIASIAACMIITLCIISAYNIFNSSTKITIDGTSPVKDNIVLQGANSVSLASARNIKIITVPINIDTNKNTIISVSCGTIVVNDAQSGEMLMTDSEYSISKDTSLLWQIPETELAQNNTITVEAKNKTYILSLVYDKATDTRTISCLKK